MRYKLSNHYLTQIQKEFLRFFGIIIWILSVCDLPFYDRQHGRLFNISKPAEEILPLYLNLMEKCLGADPLKRPSAFELLYILL
ncbi:hypothetical protein RhiirC2_800739 [Rhizophagus irregularis]|uniref:Serine-threonine/tyrosine-protein kinase catalytic domain-containing protein n=1 Tax=Rhizophagus irregularis TaxID=588596 RepID=A0A2N1M386_9GLOM|nr:hypothetical protein RhiirC2_800739 [Rhizophagus irregularis]